MSPQNLRKRVHDCDDDVDVNVKEEVGEVSEDLPAPKRTKHENKHQVQTETAAAMLQDSLVHFDKINPTTSVEVLKVAVATTKRILDKDPNILDNLTDEQCRVLVRLSKTILKNPRCNTIKRKHIHQNKKNKKELKKGWWRWFWPL